MSRQAYVDIIKSAFVTIGKRSIMAWIAFRFPFLMIPGVKQLIEYFVDRYWEDAVEFGDYQAFILFIDTRVGGQRHEFEAAALQNYIAQKNGTKREKQDAENRLIKAHRAFVHLRS